MAERLFLRMVQAQQHGLDSAIGIHSGNHGQQRGEKAHLGGTLDARCKQHGQQPDGKRCRRAGRDNVQTSQFRQGQHIAYGMADGGYQGAGQICTPGRVAYARKADGRYRREKAIFENIHKNIIPHHSLKPF